MVHNLMIFISRNIVREKFKGAPHQHLVFLSVSHNIGSRNKDISYFPDYDFLVQFRAKAHIIIYFIK